MNRRIFKDNYIPTWEVLPAAINSIVNTRNSLQGITNIVDKEKAKTILGLNYTIVLNSACLIEGCLDNFMKVMTKIKLQDKELCRLEEYLIHDFMNRISNATWSKYSSVLESILGFPIFKSIQDSNNELHKTITLLFSFRNLLAHGESVGMQHDLESSPEKDFESRVINYDNKSKKIQIFLLEKGLIDLNLKDGDPFLSKFLNDEVADFFYLKSKEFLYLLEYNLGNYPNPIIKKDRLDKAFAISF